MSSQYFASFPVKQLWGRAGSGTHLGNLLSVHLNPTFDEKRRTFEDMPELIGESSKGRAQPRIRPTQADDCYFFEFVGIALNERVDKRGGADGHGLNLGFIHLGLFQCGSHGILDSLGDVGGGGGFVRGEDGGRGSRGEVENHRVALIGHQLHAQAQTHSAEGDSRIGTSDIDTDPQCLVNDCHGALDMEVLGGWMGRWTDEKSGENEDEYIADPHKARD